MLRKIIHQITYFSERSSCLISDCIYVCGKSGQSICIVKALIEVGADVKAKIEKSGITAFSTTIMGNIPLGDILKRLIDVGADVNNSASQPAGAR